MRHARTDYDHIQDLARVDELTKGYFVAMQLQAELPSMKAHQIDGNDLQYISRVLSALLQPLHALIEGNPHRYRAIIPADEPVFLLRAKDRTAPSIVRAWAKLNIGNGTGYARIVHESEISKAALAQADAMEDYARAHYAGGKEADAPAEALRI